MEAVLVAGAIAWWCIGVFGFVFWWTSEYPLKTTDLPWAAVIGLSGPMAWVIGALFHGGKGLKREPRVLIKRRT